MSGLSLDRYVSQGVTLLGDRRCPGGVTFSFTERTGGVSLPPLASLNLGLYSGDDPAAVAENRRRALVAMGVPEEHVGRLVSPHQVHGTHVCVVRSAEPEALEAAREEALAGCDAVVCMTAGVPVLLVYADCLPVVLAAPGAFAVAHSGWRGTIGRISALALDVLCAETGCVPEQVQAYIGPHITGEDYEVSPELLQQFVDEFGESVARPGTRLDLAAAVRIALVERGVPEEQVLDSGLSTMQDTSRFYSYRAEAGTCGRIGAMAYMAPTELEGGDA